MHAFLSFAGQSSLSLRHSAGKAPPPVCVAVLESASAQACPCPGVVFLGDNIQRYCRFCEMLRDSSQDALMCTADRVSCDVPSPFAHFWLYTSIVLCRVKLTRAKGVVSAKVIAVYRGVTRLFIPVEHCFCFQLLFRALLLLQFWV